MPDIAATFEPRLPASGPFIPGGSGASGSLQNAKFVDPDTVVPLASQNGSDEAPYATIAQALTALSLVNGGAVLLSPGQYPAEVLAPATDFPITLRGLSFGDAPPCDLSAVSLANRSSLAVVDVFAIGELTYIENLWLENTNVSGSAVFNSGETPAGNATVRNSTVSGVVECDIGEASDSTIGLFLCTGISRIENVDITAQLTAGGESLIAECVVGEFSLPSGTDVSTAIVTVAGYTLENFTCFRIQNAESCRFVGLTTFIDTATMPLRNCSFAGGAVFEGPAGATLQLDSVSYRTFLAAGCSVAAGLVLAVVAAQPRATISIVVPVLLAGELGYATGSLVGTILEGIQPNTPICVTATADLSAAGAGRGGVLSAARISAANTVKVPFTGALAGGASNFIITQL